TIGPGRHGQSLPFCALRMVPMNLPGPHGARPTRKHLTTSRWPASSEHLPYAYQHRAMLELRPTCENCNSPLPPDSNHAMICSFECTFCRSCVENILANVCPNCGGGFCFRP